MNPAQLMAHFDRISEAPDAIPRLRRFILDLAVRGKLVEQDPNDEPASELLKRIQAEKARLVKEGGLKTLEPVPPLKEGEIPFLPPKRWTWIRVGDGFLYDAGVKREPKELSPDRWLLELEDIEKDTSVVLTRLKVCERDSRSTKSEFKAGDILYGKLRPYLNKVVAADEPGYSTTEIVAIRPFLPLCSAYCSLAFRRPDFVTYVNRVGQGTKMPRLRTPDALVALFPLPPLAEQHRIVAKVDELMALFDRLETAQDECESHRDRLVAASLNRLNQPAAGDGLAFRDHARFHLRHLPRLTTRPDQVPVLRQTILNLAVRGHLVPPDPNDEPVAALRQSDSPSTGLDVNVFSEALASMTVPAHWRVKPLAAVAAATVDCPHSTPKWTPSGKICVRTSQFRAGHLDLSEVRFVSETTYSQRIQRLQPVEDDILYSREGGILGVACRVPPKTELCLGQRMMLIRVGAATVPVFLEMVLNSPLITEIARQRTTGGAAPRVNVATVKAYPIPLPPLAEQHRIVAKVDELMALCDRLEAQLTTTQTESRRLLEALLHQALAPVA